MKINIKKALNDTEARRDMEKDGLDWMIKIYCHGKHHTKGDELCPQCRRFEEYAWARTDKCPFMETKTFCSACKVHCYSKEMRPYVKKVMKYAGPRMLFHHPILAALHGYVTIAQKRKAKKHITKKSQVVSDMLPKT